MSGMSARETLAPVAAKPEPQGPLVFDNTPPVPDALKARLRATSRRRRAVILAPHPAAPEVVT